MQRTAPIPDTENADWLSALLDGETEDDGSDIARIARDDGLCARWSEYCLIGDAMRGMARPTGDAVARVHAALHDEPTVLAPTRRLSQRPMLWLAAAATVTAVTWMTLRVEPSGIPVPQQQASQALLANADISPYLDAHQDYAQALTSHADMRFTQVALAMPGDAR